MPKTVLSPAPGREARPVGIFWPGLNKIPDKASLFRRISNALAGIMMAGAHCTTVYETITPESWLAPMDTSHLAEHAGTAGTLFASVFVVATTTMRTMIPLRVFAILTNIVLISTAIPTHNFLVIMVQSVVLVLNSYRLHQMLQLVR